MMRPEDSHHLTRDEQQAKDKNQYYQMVEFMRRANTKEEMGKVALMFIMDMSYQRADIALAMHTVEMERGWH